MVRGLEAGPGHGRKRRLCPADLQLSQLGHAGGAPGPTGEGGFRAEPDRYHLYAAFGCPWATRVLIARKLKRLEDVVSVAIVEPVLTDEGWRFGDTPGAGRDTVNGATYLHEIYTRADPHFTGRATVPALWDKQRQTIVNNESADLVRMFNSGFGELADASIDLYPEDLRSDIDALNAEVYAVAQQRRLPRRIRDDPVRLRGSLRRGVRDARRAWSKGSPPAPSCLATG